MTADNVTPELFDGIVEIILKNGRAADAAEEIVNLMAKPSSDMEALTKEKASLETLIEQARLNGHYARTPTIRENEGLKERAMRRALKAVDEDIARLSTPSPSAKVPQARKLKKISIIQEDESIRVLYGQKDVGYANHDEHGWSGMEALATMARNLAKAMKIEIKEN